MADITIQLYPSPINNQRAGDTLVPFSWALAYLQQLGEQIPPPFRTSARLTWAPILTYIRPQTQDETAANDRAQLSLLVADLSTDRPPAKATIDALKRLALEPKERDKP